MRKLNLFRRSWFVVSLVSMAVLLVPLASPMRNSAMPNRAGSSALSKLSAPLAKARQEEHEKHEKIYCAYWYVDQKTKAVLEITNHAPESRTVTPTLLVRGTERISLDPVTVPSRGTRRVSLNKGLKSFVRIENDVNHDARWGDGSRIGSVWGSATLQGEMMDGVSSKVLSENPKGSLAVHGGFYEYGSKSVSSQWWLPTRNSVALFAIQNGSYRDLPLATLLYLDGRVVAGPRVTLPAGGSRLFDLRELVPRSISKKLPEIGMVRFLSLADSSSLFGRAILFDEQKGFSIPLSMRDVSAHAGNTLQLAGAPFGRPDKRLRFSKSVRFTTDLLLTNTADKSVDVQVTLDGRNAAGEPASWDLPVLEMSPLQSRVVDLDEIRIKSDSPIVDGHVGVRLTHTGSPIQLSVEAVTVDRTLRYSFDNALYDNQSVSKTYSAISFNLTGNKNTLLLIKNPSNSTVNSGYRLNYEQQDVMRSYKSPPIALKPYELRVVDLRAIRDSKVPDDDGQVLPADVEFGNANIFSERPIIAGDPNYDAIAGISSSCIGFCMCPLDCACDICEMYPYLCQPPPQPSCTDTCTPCMDARNNAETACTSTFLTCEGAAFGAFIAALTACGNQAFCQEASPLFDQANCDNCKDNALIVYFAASGFCAAVYANCLGGLVDCSGRRKADCSGCP